MSPEIIACIGNKGGAGKSTLARLISASLAAKGHRVLLLIFIGNSRQVFSGSSQGRAKVFSRQFVQSSV